MNGKDIRALLKSEAFSYTKSLGQNFIFDDKVLVAIAEAADVNGQDNVLEIGPGAGTLTNQLCVRAHSVVSVEKDRRLAPVLDRVLAPYSNFRLVNDDFLETDLPTLINGAFGDGEYKVVANLPYYITTPILFKLFESGTKWKSITVMVQKEVATRLCASPSTKEYGALTATVGYYADVSIRLNVPRGIFTPPPDVDSVVVRLDRLDVPRVSVSDEKLLFKVIHSAFAMRRKTLANNLCAAFALDREACTRVGEAAGIDLMRRGETLTLGEFAALTEALIITKK